MAVTVSVPGKNDDVFGRTRARIGTLTFDSNYETGGEAITARQFGLAEVIAVIALPRPTGAASKRVVQYDPAAGKLVVLQVGAAGALVEVPAATDLSTLVVDALILGR